MPININLRGNSSALTIDLAPSVSVNWGRVKVGGSFVEIISRKYKTGGAFVDAVSIKTKIGGTFL